jgi:DNA primase
MMYDVWLLNEGEKIDPATPEATIKSYTIESAALVARDMLEHFAEDPTEMVMVLKGKNEDVYYRCVVIQPEPIVDMMNRVELREVT